MPIKSYWTPSCKSLLAAIVLIVVAPFKANSQATLNAGPQHTVYLESTLKGPVYTLNYDRVFRIKNNTRFTYRAGIYIGKNDLGLPLSLSVLKGQHFHFAELSMVVTPYVKKYKSLFSSTNLSDKYLYLFPAAGYRFQGSGKMFFKALAGPLVLLDPPSGDFWKMDPKVCPSASVAFGFTFR